MPAANFEIFLKFPKFLKIQSYFARQHSVSGDNNLLLFHCWLIFCQGFLAEKLLVEKMRKSAIPLTFRFNKVRKSLQVLDSNQHYYNFKILP